MSVILDALKKLDREKSSRRSGTANIAVEILRPDLPRPGKGIPFYAAVAFLTALAMAAITYSVMVKGGSPAKSSPPLAMNSSASNPPAEAVSLSSEPVREPRDELSPVPPKTQIPVKNKKPPSSLPENKGDEKKTNQNVILKEADIAPEKARIPAEHRSYGSAMTSPSLNISAIVWYEEPSRRFAMINGLIVTEGSVVEGMKVEEIYPDRVRFLHQNQHLEIFIK
jgi:general secretion pathway protein B